MRLIPFEIKYGAGRHLRRKKPPYCLVKTGSVVVQVGAPKDTLHAGRSRGMFFSLLLRGSGKVIIVEPDSESIREFRLVIERQGIQNVILCPVAAWSRKGAVRLFVNESHPASSFTQGTKQYNPKRLKAFREVETPANSIDNILNEIGTNTPDLISITTNGAEREILQGMRKTIASGLPYISLAATGPNYTDLMKGLGYSFLTYDDRGYTFEQERIVT